MNHKRRFHYIPVLLSGLLLTGCWDSMEINNRSIILEFIIDKNTAFSYNPTKLLDDQEIYTINYTIPDFGKLSGTESLAKDMETTIEIKAPTISSSIDDLETKSKNTVSFSHVKTIMIGEELLKAPKLFKQTVDSMSRDMLIARNVPILAVNGEAKLATEIENAEQPIVGLYVMDYFNNKERATSFFNKQLLGNFIKDMEETGISTLPIFHVERIAESKAKENSQEQNSNLEQPKVESMNPMLATSAMGAASEGAMDESEEEEQSRSEINISGGAVIKDYELMGYLTKEEVRSQLFVQGKIKNSPVVIIYNGMPMTYNIKEQKSKIKFQDSEEGLRCLVEVDTYGDVSEFLTDENQKLNATEEAKQMEELLAQEIIAQMRLGIDKSKEMNVDFMGFGLECYRKHNKLWDQYEDEWEKNGYRDMPIDIGVNVDIQSTGIQE